MPQPQKTGPLKPESCWSLGSSQRSKSVHIHIMSTQEGRNYSILMLSDNCPLGREEWRPRWGGRTLWRKGPWSLFWNLQGEGCSDTHTVQFPSFLCGFHPPRVICIGLALVILNLRQQEFEIRVSQLSKETNCLPHDAPALQRALLMGEGLSSEVMRFEVWQELVTHTRCQYVDTKEIMC